MRAHLDRASARRRCRRPRGAGRRAGTPAVVPTPRWHRRERRQRSIHGRLLARVVACRFAGRPAGVAGAGLLLEAGRGLAALAAITVWSALLLVLAG
jgi:hypothetical protein